MIKLKMKECAIFIWTLSAFFFFYEFILQMSSGVIVPNLMQSFNASGEVVGNLAALFFTAYAIMQIPVGILLDHFSARLLLTLAISTCACGSFLFGISPNIHIAELARLLMGAGASFATIGCMYLTTRWFKPEKFPLMVGLLVTIGMLGAAGSQAPLSLLVDFLGWRHSFLLFALIGFTLSLLTGLFVRDKKLPPEQIVHHDANLLKGLKYAICSKQTWIVTSYAALAYAPIPTFAGLWGVPYLTYACHLNKTLASLVVLFVFIGFSIGCPLFGWLSNNIGKRKPIMLIASIGATIALSSILYTPYSSSVLISSIFSFSFGFFTSGFIIAFTIIKEINPPQYSATALGFINTLNMLGVSIAQPLIGFILDHIWSGKIINKVRIYTPQTYRIGLTVLVISLVISILLIPFIKETYCQTNYTKHNKKIC